VISRCANHLEYRVIERFTSLELWRGEYIGDGKEYRVTERLTIISPYPCRTKNH
jgi:hypothetical protein